MKRAILRIQSQIKRRLDRWRYHIKVPRMLYGCYRDPDGIWMPDTRFSDTTVFYHPERIFLKNAVYLGHFSIIDGTGGVEIGEGTEIGFYTGIFTHSSAIAIRLYGEHYREVAERDKVGYNIAPVRIGRYAFVGPHSLVFPGVTIGDGALVIPGSVVKADVKPLAIVSGNPAVPIGRVSQLDSKYLGDPQIAQWYQEWQAACGLRPGPAMAIDGVPPAPEPN